LKCFFARIVEKNIKKLSRCRQRSTTVMPRHATVMLRRLSGRSVQCCSCCTQSAVRHYVCGSFFNDLPVVPMIDLIADRCDGSDIPRGLLKRRSLMVINTRTAVLQLCMLHVHASPVSQARAAMVCCPVWWISGNVEVFKNLVLKKF